jgi:hypothetical protein
VAGSWGGEPGPGAAGFAERLLEVIDSGRRTATYKLALLMALLAEEQDLHRHLFGRARLTPPRTLREGLASLQAGRCFYCGTPFHRAPEADHCPVSCLLPWFCGRLLR